MALLEKYLDQSFKIEEVKELPSEEVNEKELEHDKFTPSEVPSESLKPTLNINSAPLNPQDQLLNQDEKGLI